MLCDCRSETKYEFWLRLLLSYGDGPDLLKSSKSDRDGGGLTRHILAARRSAGKPEQEHCRIRSEFSKDVSQFWISGDERYSDATDSLHAFDVRLETRSRFQGRYLLFIFLNDCVARRCQRSVGVRCSGCR